MPADYPISIDYRLCAGAVLKRYVAIPLGQILVDVPNQWRDIRCFQFSLDSPTQFSERALALWFESVDAYRTHARIKRIRRWQFSEDFAIPVQVCTHPLFLYYLWCFSMPRLHFHHKVWARALRLCFCDFGITPTQCAILFGGEMLRSWVLNQDGQHLANFAARHAQG